MTVRHRWRGHRARCRAGVQQPIRVPRPADGGSMMPLVAALRTLGADLVRCDAEGMAGDDHPAGRAIAQRCASGGLAGVVPCERKAKFAADMRLGSTADDCAIGVRLRPPYGHDGGAAVIA